MGPCLFLCCCSGVGQVRGIGEEFPRLKKGVFTGFKLNSRVLLFLSER